MHIVLGGKFTDGRDDRVKPPDGVALDCSNLVLECTQHFEV